MQFPESWLRSFCNPDLNTQQLADLLTMAGLEVEEQQPVAPSFTGVVVGLVLEVAKHPDADRLNVCKVDAGTGEVLQIVCGAANVAVGIKVPCATVGAELPPGADGKPFKIKLGKLRGVESQGMLCSARELGVSEEASGLHILPDDAPVGTSIRDYLKLDDTLLTLKLTPNLAHCLSVQGVAREVSALTGAHLTRLPIKHVVPTIDDRLPVKVTAPDLCGRFAGRVIRGVNPQAPTPAWMVDRLARCGQRSVSALVDISNYVMFELGQPSHVFDLDKVHGGLTVRWGQLGESLKLLNGQTVTLDEHVGVIADEQQVESLAGVMGGDATSVGDDTRNVYLEAAFWWPKAIAGRARRYNFSTDASHRYERGVDPAPTVEAIERITQLILDICGGRAGPVDDQLIKAAERPPVTLRLSRAQRVIGMPVTLAQCQEVFTRLDLHYSTQAKGSDTHLVVIPPSWRFDLQIEEDLIEEVVRVIGFDQLPKRPPKAPIEAQVLPEAKRSLFAVRRSVASRGYQETINFSFVEERWERELAGNENPIRVLNPIASPLSVMRSSLVGSLLEVLRTNLSRKADRVRIFEIGRVFKRDASVINSDQTVAGIDQPVRVTGLAYGPADVQQWGAPSRTVDFFDVKGDVEALLAPRQPRFVAAEHPAFHPGRCARVELDGQAVGFVGELHPKWRQGYELPQAPVLFELDAAVLTQRVVPTFQAVPRLQSVYRDLALVVNDSVTHDTLMAAITEAPSEGLVRGARLFDIYKPKAAVAGMAENERSLAVRLELRDDEQTLTDERIEASLKGVLESLSQRVSARVRS
ncbi:phenylalanine--tRNA ligase subunit beta [Aquabacterium sp. CECT 9606]|uniref:phenylalanine--tRNA ligase subunit beta n=1 Tax=Aquabacterium sp. CECT 9606 TaxID=2845822 RepID=UPI001E47CE9B|nr:phenylalanine--tRNA ligase subunit beta [Aquabacterium sp. CECT 9606]CAH0355117.1 Phenylalanine--tRNA ligase beta subunit [Aquabacterium sp. CECT 9606]